MAVAVSVAPSATIRYAEGAFVTLTATGNVAPVSWTVESFPAGSGVGSFTSLSATQARWFPPDRVGTYVIRGDDGTTDDDITLTVEATLPLLPHWGYEVEIDDKVLISRAEDNSMQFRIKAGEIKSWNLAFINRSVDEYNTLHSFWTYHRKHKFFYWEDLGAEATPVLCHFNSGLKVTQNGPDNVTITCVVEEVRVG